MTPPAPPAGDTLEEVRTTPVEAPAEPGDHDVFSHYVLKDEILRAQVEGVPARALCGKVWVPSKDPEKYPVCPECQRIYDDVLETGPNVGGTGDHSGGEG